MSVSGGYVRIYRRVLEDPAFNNAGEAMAFAYLILKAAWKPVKVRYKGKVIDLKRGQLALSVRDFADDFGWSKDKCSRFLARLNRDKIATVSATGVNIITICKYDTYQASDDATATPSATLPATGPRQDRDTEQRREEGKKERIAVSDDTACDLDEPKSHAQFQSDVVVDDDDTLNVNDVVEAWNDLAKSIDRPVIKKLTEARRTIVKARLREHSIDDFAAVFSKVRRSRFLKGETNWHGFSFDWLMKQNNFIKTLEGNYDDR